ncbi:MAG: DUF4405 domain-containing protein [Synergistes sp.]|nr:DUF4405 domain-containing protein [Synergistes sp.]
MSILKPAVDAAMTLLLLLSMAYKMAGPAFARLYEKAGGGPVDGYAMGSAVHEAAGSALILLFFFHLWLNRSWIKSLFRGRYNTPRSLLALVNILLIIDVVFLLISGVMMSESLFASLPFHGGMAFARTAHMLASYWGFVIMSFHIGLYWDVMKAEISRGSVRKTRPAHSRIFLHAAAAVFVFCGVRAFVRRSIGDYMFLRSQFVFFDFDEPISRFFLDYILVMILFACLGHYLMLLLRRLKV